MHRRAFLQVAGIGATSTLFNARVLAQGSNDRVLIVSEMNANSLDTHTVGANRAESKSAYSDKEFAAKNAICLKECREARFWLRLADAKSLGNRDLRRRLLQESNELVSIYVVIVRKLKAK